MITSGLEKYILQGKAYYNTFVFGASGNGMIPVSNNSFIIITGFTSFHFFNPETDLPYFASDAIKKFIYQLKLKTGSANHSYVFRPDILFAEQSTGADGAVYDNGKPVFYGIPQGHIKMDTYILCRKDVVINVSMANTAADFIDHEFVAVSDGASDNDSPAGYADVPASQNINFFSADESEYVPLTEKGYRNVGIDTHYKEQLLFDINVANSLRQNDTVVQHSDMKNFMYPIINFEYVKFNMPFEKFTAGNL